MFLFAFLRQNVFLAGNKFWLRILRRKRFAFYERTLPALAAGFACRTETFCGIKIDLPTVWKFFIAISLLYVLGSCFIFPSISVAADIKAIFRQAMLQKGCGSGGNRFRRSFANDIG